MIRNLKALGLALAAVFALSAAIAASASAETPGAITTDGTSVTLVGDELGPEEGAAENFFAGAGGVTVKCPGSDITGHKINAPTEPVPAGATEVTITPIYTNCKNGAAVNMNGCDYRLYDTTTTGGVAGTYGVKVDIICPAGKQIEITGIPPCVIKVPPQTGIVGFHLTNDTATSPDDITLTGEANVSSTACGIPTTATQHQNVTVTGRNSLGALTEITLSHN